MLPKSTIIRGIGRTPTITAQSVPLDMRSLGGTFPEYLPLIQAVSASIKPWKPEAALLLEKPVRLAGVKGPNGTEEGTAAQDHQAEKDGGDALARLLAAVQSARGQGG